MNKLNLVILVITFGLLNVQAQFKINGEIKNYNNSPILVKIYDNGVDKLVSRVETDSKGVFTANIPIEYTGLIILEIDKGGYKIVAINKDISFVTDYKDNNREIDYKSKFNNKLNEYYKQTNLIELKEKTLKPLLNFYDKKDDFHSAISKEINRINNLSKIKIDNEDVEYYLLSREFFTKLEAKSIPADQGWKEIKERLINNGSVLERFGLLRDYVRYYISYSLSGAKDRDSAKEKMEDAINTILEELGVETQRGQAVLTTVIKLLESNGFKEVADKYVDKAESLGCEMSEDLKDVLNVNKNIQPGKKAPNFEFTEKIKGKTSLYQVKADRKLLIFWGSWCPHCINELPFIKEYYKQFKKEGGEIVAFAVDIRNSDYKKLIDGTDWYNVSDLLKWESPVVKKFGISGTPTMLMLDKDNTIIKIGSRISDFIITQK